GEVALRVRPDPAEGPTAAQQRHAGGPAGTDLAEQPARRTGVEERVGEVRQRELRLPALEQQTGLEVARAAAGVALVAPDVLGDELHARCRVGDVGALLQIARLEGLGDTVPDVRRAGLVAELGQVDVEPPGT